MTGTDVVLLRRPAAVAVAVAGAVALLVAGLCAAVLRGPGGPYGPSPEQAWNALTASCTDRGAYPYRGIAPAVVGQGSRGVLITVSPAAPARPLALRYVRGRGLLHTEDRIEPADTADVALLAELGCAKGLAWRPSSPPVP